MNIPNPQDIVRKAEEIARGVPNDRKVQEFLQALRHYVAPETPSHERGWRGMIGNIFDLPFDLRKTFSDILFTYLQPWEESLGYRSKTDIMTLQEHTLIGSTVPNSRKMNPYIPVGFYTENYTVEEVNTARALQKYSTSPTEYFSSPEINQEIGKVTVTLEPIDSNKITVRDPQPVNRSLELILNYTKSEDFPFKRAQK